MLLLAVPLQHLVPIALHERDRTAAPLRPVYLRAHHVPRGYGCAGVPAVPEQPGGGGGRSGGYVSGSGMSAPIVPVGEVISAGVPGYSGHVPSGVGSAPYMVANRSGHVPQQADFASWPHKARGFDHDAPHRPRARPPPGYGGHVHMTTDSAETFGTSRWAAKTFEPPRPRVISEADYRAGPPQAKADMAAPMARTAEEAGRRMAATIATLGAF